MGFVSAKMESLEDLDRHLLAAHTSGRASDLVRLYRKAGEWKEGCGDIDAACFYYTHAYVYALENGDGDATLLRARLVRYGREQAYL